MFGRWMICVGGGSMISEVTLALFTHPPPPSPSLTLVASLPFLLQRCHGDGEMVGIPLSFRERERDKVGKDGRKQGARKEGREGGKKAERKKGGRQEEETWWVEGGHKEGPVPGRAKVTGAT